MFSRFQTLVAGLKFLNKIYTTRDHLKKFLKSLPKKWRPKIITIKKAKCLNKILIKDMVDSHESREIDLNEDKNQRNPNYIGLKNKIKKIKAL